MFDLEERALPIGATILAAAAIRYLEGSRELDEVSRVFRYIEAPL